MNDIKDIKNMAAQLNRLAAKNLKRIRKEKGCLSASKFATEHGIKIQTYLNWESGKRGMSIGVICYLAKLLNVSYLDVIPADDIDRIISGG